MKHFLLYGFLVSAFFGVTVRNHDNLTVFKSLDGSPFLDYDKIYSWDSREEQTFDDMSDKEASRVFREDLELVKLLGTGDVSYGFKAIYKNKTVVAKVATDNDLYYSDIEIGVFRELNAAPTIPNIPHLYLGIRSMPNPFVNDPRFNDSIAYLVNDLGVKRYNADSLVMKRRISVMVMDLLRKKRQPKDLEEVQRFMKSLLETMEFVHSRNIMHCDLHQYNYHWDGHRAYLFDWNGAFRYEPDKVLIHYPRTPSQLFPPEATHNSSAVHTSVHAFDVYTMGKLLRELLKTCCGVTFKKLQTLALNAIEQKKEEGAPNSTTPALGASKQNDSSKQTGAAKERNVESILDEAVAYELALYMMTTNPYERPTTTEALRHVFFERNITKKTRKL